MALTLDNHRVYSPAPAHAEPSHEQVSETKPHEASPPTWVIALSAIVAVLLLFLTIVGALAGYRVHYMSTPSMGTAIPVGAVAVTAPANIAEVSVGDVVTSRLPNGITRTHRVIEVTERGLTTQGDLNQATDPNPTTQDTLVGKVVFSAPALGWALRMIPWVAGMWLLMALASSRMADPVHRSRYRALGVYIGLCVAVLIVRPLLGVEALDLRVHGSGEDAYAASTVVSTGLLPVKVVPFDGQGEETAVLHRSGETGTTSSHALNDDGEFVFFPRLVFTWAWMLAYGALLASPWLWFYLQYRQNEDNALEETEEIEEVDEAGA